MNPTCVRSTVGRSPSPRMSARSTPGAPNPVTLSTKHTLALTNRGAAKASDVIALAREIRDGVVARFGVALHPEPVLVDCAL